MRNKSVLSVIAIAMALTCSHDLRSAGPERSDDEAAVLMAVQKLFDAMESKDVAGARAVVDPEGDFVSVRWNEDGERVVRRSSIGDFLERLKAQKETYLERMWEPEVWIRGPIAVVWTPYDFHLDGKFSHCGIDAFQLLQTPAGWIITAGTYTVEQTGCEESPLGAVESGR